MSNRYDYNHSSSGHQFIVLAMLVIAVVVILGGLILGLNILDHF